MKGQNESDSQVQCFGFTVSNDVIELGCKAFAAVPTCTQDPVVEAFNQVTRCQHMCLCIAYALIHFITLQQETI